MMPMAGEDAVIDAAAFEREAHMRTAVVEREDLAALVHQQYWAMAAVHDEPSLVFQLVKAARANEIGGDRIHRRLIR